MHFDGVTEQLCKTTRERLKKFLQCRSNWAKLNCRHTEIAKTSYENMVLTLEPTYEMLNTIL